MIVMMMVVLADSAIVKENVMKGRKPKPFVWVYDENGCKVSTSHKTDKGYIRMRIDGKNYRLHRLVYASVHGPIPEGLVVRHTCDNPGCINIDHLLIGTHQDNVRDRVERGRGRNARGESHGKAKLTKSEAYYVKFFSSDKTASELAERFDVDVSAVRQIRNSGTWKHLELEEFLI